MTPVPVLARLLHSRKPDPFAYRDAMLAHPKNKGGVFWFKKQVYRLAHLRAAPLGFLALSSSAIGKGGRGAVLPHLNNFLKSALPDSSLGVFFVWEERQNSS
jgi:hypothetical protein